MNILEGLNPEQEEAVKHFKGRSEERRVGKEC